jgi:mycothiol synthase
MLFHLRPDGNWLTQAGAYDPRVLRPEGVPTVSESKVVRPAEAGDADLIAEFINVCTLAYQGVSRSSRPDALARLHQHGSNPEKDSFLLFSETGVLSGFAHLWRADEGEIKLFARTRPDAAGRGVGTRLLELCEARARELFAEGRGSPPTGRLTTTSWAADARAPALLETLGYRELRYFMRMEIGAERVGEHPPSWPEGLTLRPLVVDGSDDRGVYDAWCAAFAEHFGPAPEDQAAFWHERRDAKLDGRFRFDPSLWWIALDGDAVVGFSFCEESASDDSQIGRVAEIGVYPTWRGRGLGYSLLVHSLQELKRRGASKITLDVDADNVTSALRLYTKAGMTGQPAFTIWERLLNTADLAVEDADGFRGIRPG